MAEWEARGRPFRTYGSRTMMGGKTRDMERGMVAIKNFFRSLEKWTIKSARLKGNSHIIHQSPVLGANASPRFLQLFIR